MRYKTGWLMPHTILALTHFVPEVTPDDFAGIAASAERALADLRGPFHLLIDNRLIASTQLATIELILQALPGFDNQHLRWIIIILPDQIKAQARNLALQQVGQIRLAYVSSLAAAYAHLRDSDPQLDWATLERSFFEPV